jgi:helicase
MNIPGDRSDERAAGMSIEALEAYDVEPALIDLWRATVGPRLLPVQERAIKEFGLFGDQNLVVFSPTSSGKTFIGEMAAVKAARANSRVFYLVPQRALADEKYRELRARYVPVGLDVVVSSRDHREHDAQIRARSFEIAIVVFEKLRALLVSQPNLLADVGLVVVDELQVLTDVERGPTLELLLTKLRTGERRPRLIGLSAVLGRAEPLTDWLGARLLVDERRPVELRKGVLCQGEFCYREHNSDRVGREPFRSTGSKDRRELMLAAAEELLARGEQALLFVPDRASAVGLARVLAGRVTLPAASAALEELGEAEDTHMRDALAETLGSGIAFHHADLTGEEREIVERAFRTGAIGGLVATSTLAIGVNLPARNVILDGRKWIRRGADRPYLEDLGKSEYENMSGRAGRLGFTRDFGRSILVTHSPFQARSWLEHYIDRAFEDMTPALAHDRLEDLVLDLVASGLGRSRTQVADLLLGSFTGRVRWAEQMDRARFLAAVDAAIAVCAEGGLLKARSRGTLVATRVGQVAAAHSIGAETASAFARWAKDASAGPAAPLEVLMLLGRTAAGGGVHVRYSYREGREVDYKAELLGRAGRAGVEARSPFQTYAGSAMALEDDDARAVKKALMLQDWMEELPTREIERRYETWAGSLRRIGEEYGWLCEGLAAVCGACGWRVDHWRSIERLGGRLGAGVQEDALPLLGLGVKWLGRSLVPRLRAAGLLDLREIRRAGPEVVRRAVGHPRMVDALFDKLAEGRSRPRLQAAPAARAAEATPGQEATAPPPRPAAAAPGGVELVVDLPTHRVTLWGTILSSRPPRNLQPQLFHVLTALAARAGEVVSMVDLASDLQRLGGLPRKPVAPDARDLRYRLLRSLRAGLAEHPNGAALDRVVENVPGFGLRLNCTARVVGPRVQPPA